MNTDSHDKRRYQRHEISGDVLLSDTKKTWSTKLVNISQGGACVNVPEEWPAIDPEKLSLIVLGQSDAWIAECEVSWGDAEHLGLMFTEPHKLPFGLPNN
jgi:hypothetical protein